MRTKWSSIVAAGLLVTASSVASAKILPVPLKPQETNMWCWAASGQMIMNYLGATGVTQCDQANRELGRTDCCASPTPSACVKGGHTQFDQYNFDLDYADGALSFSALSSEIDANRPVEFAWSWTGGGGHVMVAVGYTTINNVNYVYDQNPWPPNQGVNHELLTYSRYVSDTDHTHQDDAYHIHDVAPCHSDFHDLAAGDFQECFDYWALRGKFPVTLAAYQNGSTYMAGSFQTVPSRPVRTLLTAAQFQTYFNSYAAAGWRPESVSVLSTSSGPRFTAIWTPVEAPFLTYFGMDAASFNSNFATNANNGYLITDLYAYEDNGTKYVATWVKKANNGYITYINMTAADYNSKFSTYAAQGLRPTRFSAVNTASGIRYSAIWQALPDAFYHYYDMTSASYQSTHDTLANAGYHLSSLTALVDRISAIWVK